MGRLVRACTVVGLAAGTAFALSVVGAPSPSLFAGFFVAAAAGLFFRREVRVPVSLGRAGQAVLGATVATQVDLGSWVELRRSLPAVVGVAGAAIGVAALMGMGLRLRGASTVTALLASVPGGASTVTSIADDLGADRRVVVVVQYLRVVIVIVTLPVLLALVFHEAVGETAMTRSAQLSDGFYVAMAAGVGLLSGRLFRLPASALTGPLIVGVLAGLAPIWSLAVTPPALLWTALLVIGLQAGSGFTTETIVQLRRMMPTAVLTSVLLVAFCAAASVPFALWTGASPLDAYLATSPGGLPVVIATSLETGDDPALVSFTQVLRLILVIAVLALVHAIVRRRFDRP